LGIPAAEQPPHHYRLLGLPLFTDDQAAISRALQARIAQVRLADAGRQPELAERLVAELTLARQTLLDPPKKLTYDAILRGARISLAAAQPVPMSSEETSLGSDVGRIGNPSGNEADLPDGLPIRPTPKPTPILSPNPSGTRVDQPPVAPGGARADRPRVAPGTALFIGIAGVGAAAIVLGLILSFASRPRGAKHNSLIRTDGLPTEEPAMPGPATPARLAQAANPSARPPRPEKPSPRVPRVACPPVFPAALAGKQPVAAAPKVADSMVQGEAAPPPSPEVAALLTAARRAMFDRNLKAAGQDVDRAVRTARSDGDRAAAERVSKLLHSLETFWQAAGDGCRQLQSGEELELADAQVIVVGVDATGITIRAAGRNLDYAFQELPRPLAVLAAERRLSQDPQAINLHVGSFLAVDRRGDREEARRRWEKAGPDGQSLMPEAALAPPVETIKPGK
jgi:hypothetical protein